MPKLESCLLLPKLLIMAIIAPKPMAVMVIVDHGKVVIQNLNTVLLIRKSALFIMRSTSRPSPVLPVRRS